MKIEEIVYDKLTIDADVLIGLGYPELVDLELLRIDDESWICFNEANKIKVIPSCNNLETYYDSHNTYDNVTQR